MSQLLTDEFDDFFQKIQLRDKQADRIQSAVDALSEYLIKYYELSPEDYFIQGSFSTNTVVRPAPSKDGEYDVDLVIFSPESGATPDDAINDLEAALEANGNYKEKIEKDDPKIPCVRLRYADEDKARFHVDIVPAKPNNDGTIDVPRRGDGWETSNPAAYTSWVLSQGDRYQRTLMMLKRWRDENEAPIKSIVLQVLVANSLSEATDDAINLAETFRNIANFFDAHQSAPELNNPVLAGEVITSRWDDSDFLKFKELIDEAADVAENALDDNEHDEAAGLWQKLLGEDFIFQTDKQVSVGNALAKLGDTSHTKPLVFPYLPPQGVKVEIEAYFRTEHKRQVFKRKVGFVPVIIARYKRKIVSGSRVKSGGHLDYYAHVHGLRGKQYQIHWQVVNTGDEATRKDGLRGTFFTPKDTNNLKYNYEQTSYEGTHWIECFVIMDNVCVARSGRFYIDIYH